MLSAIYTDERLFLRIGLAVLAFAVLGYVYTGFLPLLVAPMLWVYVVLMLKNWKMAFWLFLFFIPLSVRFSFSGNSLSLCVPDEPMMWSFLLLGEPRRVLFGYFHVLSFYLYCLPLAS